jgi:hypothetical protein
MSDLDKNFLPKDPLERAKMLESELVIACEGNWDKYSRYVDLRRLFLQDPILKSLLPDFVRTCRDLQHFWPYIKNVSPKWAPRRQHVRDALSPLFNHLEDARRAPVDGVASDALTAFDANAVQVVWQKSLDRRHTDPEGAITLARTLLETVCKSVLERTQTPYGDRDDMPALYKKVAEQLNIAPSQHTEETFRRILGGCTSVVEGLGSLRSKLGDAHGRAAKAAPVKPSARHAQLAVNLAGAMATFIVETWLARSQS